MRQTTGRRGGHEAPILEAVQAPPVRSDMEHAVMILEETMDMVTGEAICLAVRSHPPILEPVEPVVQTPDPDVPPTVARDGGNANRRKTFLRSVTGEATVFQAAQTVEPSEPESALRIGPD